MSLNVSTRDHDGSLPGAPQRPTRTDADHAAITELRSVAHDVRRLLARLVDSGHMDDLTLGSLREIAAKTAALHAHLDTVDAAWLAAHASSPKEVK